MLGEDAKRNQLMGALDEHAYVKAALVVDQSGSVKARVGRARALKSAAGATEQVVARGGADDLDSKENVYLVGVGADFLIVIFDDGVDFDGVKSDVDGLIADLEL